MTSDSHVNLEDVSGPLFFPVTPFGDDGEIRLDVLRAHIEQRLADGAGAVVVAGGAGEFHTLSASEVADVCATAVQVVDGRIPVLSGTGGPLGHAITCARGAADAGVDGLLALPPYLVLDSAPDGLVAYVEAIAAVTDRPIVVYHRAAARYDIAAVRRLLGNPRVIGLKDGLGDVAFLGDVLAERARSGREHDFAVLNGLPTAEIADASYRAAGIGVYSSAVFAASPPIALAFYRAAITGDSARCDQLIDEFYTAFDRMRSSRPGHGLAFVKAAVELGGLPCGPVRPPLTDIDEAERTAMAALFARASALVGSWA